MSKLVITQESSRFKRDHLRQQWVNVRFSRMLERDMNNLYESLGRFAPSLLTAQCGAQIWSFHRQGLLRTDTVLIGQFTPDSSTVDLKAVMDEIEDVRLDEVSRRVRMGG